MSVIINASPPIVETPVLAASWESLWRLSVEQYHAMARQGILVDGAPIELLEGLLVKKMTISPAHRLAMRRARVALERVAPLGCFVDAPSPVTLSDSEPEPDVVVVRGADGDFAQRHPGPDDLLLVVEVSDSSLHADQVTKKRIYAKAASPVYWILNLVDRRIEVYSNPTGTAELPDYRSRQEFSSGEQVPLVIDGRQIAQLPVAEMLA